MLFIGVSFNSKRESLSQRRRWPQPDPFFCQLCVKLAICRPLTLVLSMYPTFSKEINTLLMASVAPLDCQSKSLNLMPAKFSQNFPEAPPTASCKVAQGIVPGHFFFSTTLLRVKTVCSCHPFMVALTICFMCITTISECYHLSFIV